MLSENICVLFVLLFSLTVVFSCSALTLRCDVVLCVNTARKGGDLRLCLGNGVKVQSRHSPRCLNLFVIQTHAGGRAQLAEVKERTDGVCFRVCLWGARVECQRV